MQTARCRPPGADRQTGKRRNGRLRPAACVIDGEITTWIQDGLVAVVKTHEIRRRTVCTADFDDLAVPVGRADRSAMNDDPISLGCFHRNHLPGFRLRVLGRCGNSLRAAGQAAVRFHADVPKLSAHTFLTKRQTTDVGVQATTDPGKPRAEAMSEILR